MASQNYTLGRGRLFFDQFATGTKNKTGERYIGNTPEFGLNVASESLDHYNADEGIRVKDASVLLEVTYAGNFITDEINSDNLALFFLGNTTTLTDAGGPVTAEAIDGVKQGLFYQLGVSNTNPSGVRKVTSVVVKNDTTPTPVTFVAGTDYVLDADLGRIQIVTGGAITNGTNLRINYTVTASVREQVVTAGTIIEGALRFVSYNAAGTLRDYYFPYVKLAPSGDFALKGQDWLQIAFDMEALKLSDAVETIYIDGRPA